MLALAFAVDSLLVCAIASLGQCAEAGSLPTISEMMLRCKRGDAAFVPWLCLAAQAVVSLVQLPRMQRAAARWCAQQARGAQPPAGRAVPALAAVSVAGFALVVACDHRGAGDLATAGHRVGVVLLAAGGFGALQAVWWTLRAGDAAARVQHAGSGDAPWYSWVEADVVFAVLLGVFAVATLADADSGVGAACEYAAFALLLAQTTWLLVLCEERKRAMFFETDYAEGAREAGWALGALLAAYALEAAVVLAVVL